MHIYLPPKINIIVFIKNKKNSETLNIVLQNNKKKFLFYVKKNESLLKFDKNTNSIILEKNWLFNSNNKFTNFLLKFFKSWDYFFFAKIKFKGKGFRIRFFKKNKFVKFFFGRSHKTFMFYRKLVLKKISKYKFTIKSINYDQIKNASKLSINIKPMNMYTLRGLRDSKQIIYKRKGKKGTYI